jgi:peptide/nickel transport system substrate-binding protein
MRLKLLVSAIAAVVGATLLIASAMAGTTSSAASAKAGAAAGLKGGTLRVNIPNGDFEYVDPGLAYDTLGWSMLYTTQMLLVNFPEKEGPAGSKIYPEGATAFPKVSRDGRTYTFTVRSGLKFSDGSPITAAAWKRALERNLSPKMYQGSPVGVNVHLDDLIQGGKAFLEGKTQVLSGVRASGRTLTVRLTKADPTFLAIMAMQWFGAIKPNTPYSDKGLDVYPGSGPYFIKARDVGKSLLLERNPNYKGSRPANPDKIIFNVNLQEAQSLLQVRNGEADITVALPVTSHEQLGSEFGVNKGRYFVGPNVCVSYWALNTSRAPLNNVALRKAVNWAVDRPAMLRVAGKYAGKRHDQILVPGVPGYKNFHLYAIKGSDITKAKQVAGGAGAIAGKTVTLFYPPTSTAVNQAQVVQYNMKQLGFDVKLNPTPSSIYYKTLGTKGVDMDIARAGWCADYNDPFDFINVLVDGNTIQDANNVNFAYLNNAALNRKMAAASRLSGDARYTAYQKLDLEIMRDISPWVPYGIPNSRFFVSARTKNIIYQPYFGEPVYSAASVG